MALLGLECQVALSQLAYRASMAVLGAAATFGLGFAGAVTGSALLSSAK